MHQLLKKIKARLVRLLEYAVAVLMALLILDVLWQVIARKVLKNPSTWTDELAVVLLIWVALLGAGVAFERKGHLGVDYFLNKLAPRAKAPIELAVYLLIAFFAVEVLMYGGMEVVSRVLAAKQPLPSLGIEMGYVYLALPISGCFILLVSIETIAEKLLALREGSAES